MVIYHVQGLSTDREDCRAHPTQNIITHRLTLKHTKKQVEAVCCCRNYCVCRCGTEHKTQPTSYSTQHTAHSTQHTAAQCCNVLCCAALCACCDLWGAAEFIHPSTAYGRLHSCTQHTAHTTHHTPHTGHNTQQTAHRHSHTHA